MVPFLFLVGQQTMEIPAGSLAKPKPATAWSCELSDADGKRFQLSGRFDEVPAGANTYENRPTTITGNGPAYLLGKVYFTAGAFTNGFRDYDVSARGEGNSASRLRLSLRQGGHGLIVVLRTDPPKPYDHIATGLCTSDFGPTGKAD
jgi:hypothetical protein